MIECSMGHWRGPPGRSYCPVCSRWLGSAVTSSPGPALVAADHTFKPDFFEHLGENGTYVTSKRQLKEVCDKNNLISHKLEF